MGNDSNYYEKDGKKYDRITRILGYFKNPELVKWQMRVGAKEAKRISTIAMKRGTAVDEYIRIHVTDKKEPKKFKTIEEENCFKAYLQWRKDYNISVITSATTQYDHDACIAGTPDIWLLDETLDIKCASAIRQNYWLQTEWYARKKGHHFKSILRLDANLGCYEYVKKPVSDYDFQIFEALVSVYRFYNAMPTEPDAE